MCRICILESDIQQNLDIWDCPVSGKKMPNIFWVVWNFSTGNVITKCTDDVIAVKDATYRVIVA